MCSQLLTSIRIIPLSISSPTVAGPSVSNFSTKSSNSFKKLDISITFSFENFSFVCSKVLPRNKEVWYKLPQDFSRAIANVMSSSDTWNYTTTLIHILIKVFILSVIEAITSKSCVHVFYYILNY